MVSYLSYALITRFTEICRELQADILDSGALCQPGPGRVERAAFHCWAG